MLVSHSEKGYSCHCFRCDSPDSHQFRGHGIRSIADLQRHKDEILAHRGKPPHLPSDYTKDIPAEYAWFLKYGISLEVAQQYDFGYSEFFHRIVIPIYRQVGYTRELSAVHLRAIDLKEKSKYFNLGKPDVNALFQAKNTYPPESGLVITEDILSAIKVNLAGYNSVALNGSDITDGQAVQTASRTAVRYIWLDNDPAGHKGSKKAIQQLLMQGSGDVRLVRSEGDPKTYNKEEIKQHLMEAIPQ